MSAWHWPMEGRIITSNGPQEQRFTVETKLESIPLIQQAITAAAAAPLDSSRLFRLNMAVEELVTNVVRHSGTLEPIGVTILVTPGVVSVELSDAGALFNPFMQAKRPVLDASLEDRPIGGLGVHLVTAMLDQVAYRRADDRNHVLLTMYADTGGGNS